MKQRLKLSFGFSLWAAITWANTETPIIIKETPPVDEDEISALPLKKMPEPLEVFDCIKQDVEFWARVYREWDTNQVIFYDSITKVVYDVINLPKVEFGLSSGKYRADVAKRYKEITEVLKSAANPSQHDDVSQKTKHILDVAKINSIAHEPDLAERCKYQAGLRSQFEFGLKKSGLYIDEMKSILLSQDLPEDLLGIPFVESLFYPSAVSHAGAAGLWGLMKDTAIRSGIHVNKFTDERLDPLLSTVAAAAFIKKMKESLGEWSLVYTGYNYGPAGVTRAINNLQSRDLCVIIAKHDGGWFKYASKNYYSEVVAAIDTLRNQQTHFPGLEKEKPWKYELVKILRPAHVEDLFAVNAVSKADLIRLNPSFTKNTLNSVEVIPPNYELRIPKGTSKDFYARVKKIANGRRDAASVKISTKYVARGRESLNYIAKLFGVSPTFLSERMKKPLDYKPKGPVIIRSQSHLFYDKTLLSEGALRAVTEVPQPNERPIK